MKKRLVCLLLLPLLPLLAPAEEFLETGGVHFQLTDGHYEWAAQKPFVDLFLLGMGPALAQDPTIPPGISEFLRDIPSVIGLDQIQRHGSSTVPLPEGGFRSRWMLQHAPNAPGLLWKGAGDRFDPVQELRRLPPTASMVLRYSLNATELRTHLGILCTRYGLPDEIRAEIRNGIESSGFPLEPLLQGIQQGITLAICLNPDITWTLPVPVPGGLQTPEMGIALMIGDPSGALHAHLLETLKATRTLPVLTLETEGFTVHSLPIPAPLPSPIALQFARLNGRLLLTTSPLLMTQMLQRREGIADSPLADRLAQSSLRSAQILWACDERFPAMLLTLLRKGATLAPPDTSGELLRGAIETWSGLLPLMTSSLVTLHEDNLLRMEHLHSLPLPPQKAGTTTLTAPVTIGLLAGIAIPGFVKARETAQSKACINNLRMIEASKDQWAIENLKNNGDKVTPDDLREYLHRWPACPADGDYTINPIGTRPTCSHEGHVSP